MKIINMIFSQGKQDFLLKNVPTSKLPIIRERTDEIRVGRYETKHYDPQTSDEKKNQSNER